MTAALSAVLFAATLMQSPHVMVVRAADASGRISPGPADTAFVYTCTALGMARVPYLKATDPQIADQGFSGVRVAIFVACKTLTPGTTGKLAQFLASGGHAIFVQYLPRKTARAAGWSAPEVCSARAGGGYNRIALPPDRPLGLPAEVPLHASQVSIVRSAADKLGLLVSSADKRQPVAAIYLGGKIGFIACALVGADPEAAGALLRGLVGHYDASLWPSLIPADASALPLPDGRLNLAGLVNTIKPLAFPYALRAMIAARKAQTCLDQAHDSLKKGLIDSALDLVQDARRSANTAFWSAFPSRQDELRGMWTCNTVPVSWDVAAEALANAHINVVFPYMASGAAAYYRSSVLPSAAGDDSHDWLADAIAACHAHGIRVHARILGLSCLFATPQTVASLAAAGRLVIDDKGHQHRWLCPTCRANRNALIEAVTEIASKYAVDGIQFDYFRYPDERCCVCPRCRAAFEQYFGRKIQDWPASVEPGGPAREAFNNFRRQQLNSLLAECRSAILRARPGLPISAAVWVNWPVHREGIAQDWVAWLNKGLIDFACPMDYTANTSRFKGWVEEQRGWAPSAKLCFGIGPCADGVGTFPPLTVARQIGIARENGQGWVIYNLSRRLMMDYLPPLALGISHDQASLPAWAGGA